MKDPARVAGGVDNRLNEDPSLFPYLSPMYVSFGNSRWGNVSFGVPAEKDIATEVTGLSMLRGKLHSYDKI